MCGISVDMEKTSRRQSSQQIRRDPITCCRYYSFLLLLKSRVIGRNTRCIDILIRFGAMFVHNKLGMTPLDLFHELKFEMTSTVQNCLILVWGSKFRDFSDSHISGVADKFVKAVAIGNWAEVLSLYKMVMMRLCSTYEVVF